MTQPTNPTTFFQETFRTAANNRSFRLESSDAGGIVRAALPTRIDRHWAYRTSFLRYLWTRHPLDWLHPAKRETLLSALPHSLYSIDYLDQQTRISLPLQPFQSHSLEKNLIVYTWDQAEDDHTWSWRYGEQPEDTRQVLCADDFAILSIVIHQLKQAETTFAHSLWKHIREIHPIERAHYRKKTEGYTAYNNLDPDNAELKYIFEPGVAELGIVRIQGQSEELLCWATRLQGMQYDVRSTYPSLTTQVSYPLLYAVDTFTLYRINQPLPRLGGYSATPVTDSYEYLIPVTDGIRRQLRKFGKLDR